MHIYSKTKVIKEVTDKMTKKNLILGLIIIMSFGLFVGCGKDLKLDAELKSRIEHDYLQQFGKEFYGEFYGTYGESTVFFILGANLMMKDITISGVKFCGTSDWKILVWNDETFYDLEDIERIIELGILTQNNLKQIGRIHAKNNKAL